MYDLSGTTELIDVFFMLIYKAENILRHFE